MLNKLTSFAAQYGMLEPGDQVVCALSGGPDSMALLWALYLLREKLQLQLSAAHFNHGLRGEESDRDQEFVTEFCRDYDIPLHLGSASVVSGAKGLEAAARDARYAFLESLPGKIATAHHADDNAETVLMHLVRGTGLKGLGGIAPVRGRLIRPMLGITHQEILAFLEEYHIPYVLDSTNGEDAFLRNRIRHQVMPLLRQENPAIPENMSAMALRLRQDEQALDRIARQQMTTDVNKLRSMDGAVRSRVLTMLLTQWGVREPERVHVVQLEKLVNSPNPSAKARFAGGITVTRVYDRLELLQENPHLEETCIACPGVTKVPGWNLKISCYPVEEEQEGWQLHPQGQMVIRSRQAGDTFTLPGGTKTLKKIWIDRKIPASLRSRIPVLADHLGVLAAGELGPNPSRQAHPTVTVRIETDYQEDRE